MNSQYFKVKFLTFDNINSIFHNTLILLFTADFNDSFSIFLDNLGYCLN